MPCPHCGREIEKGILTCPFCLGEVNPPLEECLERAIKLINEEQSNEAIEFLKEVITRYPQSADAHSLLASLYEEIRDLPSAIYHYRQVVEINPSSTAEKRKLELLTGERYSPKRLPLLPPALALLGVLFIVLLVTSFPRRKQGNVESNLITNEGSYPYYNQWQMPYYYYPNTTNLPPAENITPSPSSSSHSSSSQTPPTTPTKTLPSPLTTGQIEHLNQSSSQPLPPTNILIQPTTPSQSQPPQRKSRISITVKKVPPSFDSLYAEGLNKLKEKDFAESEKLLRRSLSLAPDERKAEVHLFLAMALKEQGKWSEAREQFALAEQLLVNRNDPYSQQLLQQAKEGKIFCEERM